MLRVEDLTRELHDAAAHAARLAEGHPPKALARRPGPKRWSGSECLEHLNLTTRAYLPKLENAYAELRVKNLRGDGPYRVEALARLLHWVLEPPVRLRMPTAAGFVPPVEADPARVAADFARLQQRLLDLLARGRGLALDRVRLVSPFSEHMRYNAAAAFWLIAVHQRRHLWQAERALAAGCVDFS